MDLVWIKDKLPEDQAELLTKTASDIEMVAQTIQLVKNICTELRPNMLDVLGLGAAIEWQAAEFEKRTGIRCTVEIDPHDIELDEARTIALFRICQEALTNVLKHAKATEVYTRLMENDGIVMLDISDNGVGITENQLAKQGSFGLMGMKERVYPFAGTVTIIGKSGHGTTLTIKFPKQGKKK
jgi:signal transduction histidine kinase